jgi:hypothetical protein
MIEAKTTADLSDLRRLQRNLKAYVQVRKKKTTDEILNQKGNDLRIRLFRGFFAQRWKKGAKGGGFKLLKSLVAQGKGVLVRLMQLVPQWAGAVPQQDKNGRALSLHQKLVAQEMLRRQSGVGVLGVSFLRKRWAIKNNERFLITNKTKGFGKAVTFEKRADSFIISGFTPGLARVAAKYGVLLTAIRAMSRDIEKYLRRKVGDEFVEQLHAS